MVRYTPDQMMAFHRKAEEVAEDALSRHGVSDPEGVRRAKLVRFFYQDLDEWALVLGFG